MTASRRVIIGVTIVYILIIAAIVFYRGSFGAPGGGTGTEQFTVAQNETNTSDIVSDLKTQGFIKSAWAFNVALHFRNALGTLTPGGYEISKTMSAWQIAGVLSGKPSLAWVVIPEGLRKEEIAALLMQKLSWSAAEETEWITKDTSTDPDYFEGVYFPDTYLIPVDETPLQVAQRLQAHFEEKFAPYAAEAITKNIKWTIALTLASIIQREAANASDMPLVASILWNRLLATPPMRLQVDSTVQYVRGNTGAGWWAPITPTDESIDSPYNTYLYAGLPPHPICNPGLDAINAALNPASTTCLYYIHDSSKTIHCATTYAEQQQNIEKYLQ